MHAPNLRAVPTRIAAQPAAPLAAFVGRLVELRPLEDAHAADLLAVAPDGSQVMRAREAVARGTEQAFTIFERATGKIVGSISILNVKPEERSLEIGWNWIASSVQRRGLSRESIYLLLQYAFEHWGAVRVSFVVDEHNGRARGSLVRLGAVYEGTLRFHRSTEGTRRNDAMYSIIKPEWPQVRAQIEFRFMRASHNARLCSLPFAYPSGA